MPIKAVIFDFGGVLVRSMTEAGRFKWDRHYKLPDGTITKMVFDSEVAAKATIGQAAYADIWQNVADKLKVDPTQLEALKTDFWSGDRLDEDLRRFVGSLRPQYKTAILSNAWPNARAMFTEKFRLHEVTDDMIISAEVGIAKPDPHIYQITVDRLKVRPAEAIFVDDFQANIESAQKFGLKTVWFKSPVQAVMDVKKYLEAHSALH